MEKSLISVWNKPPFPTVILLYFQLPALWVTFTWNDIPCRGASPYTDTTQDSWWACWVSVSWSVCLCWNPNWQWRTLFSGSAVCAAVPRQRLYSGSLRRRGMSSLVRTADIEKILGNISNAYYCVDTFVQIGKHVGLCTLNAHLAAIYYHRWLLK